MKAKSDEKAELQAKSEAKLDNESSNESNDLDNDLSNESDNEQTNDKINDNINVPEVPEDATDENPLGLQLSEDKVPFEIEGGKSGETYDINDNEDRQRLINDNKVDDKDILDIDMPKHVHKAIKELCKKMGLKVQFLYMGARSNGWIENGTMYLALDTEKATQFVFGHEMTHAIKQKNPEAYKELVKVAMAVTTKKKFEEDLAKVYQNYHGISGYNNVDDYVEEVVADNLGKFINDFDLAQKFSLRLNHPVLGTILHAIQKIKSLLYGDFYKSVDALERIVEKAYVDTAKGEVTNSETGEDVSYSLRQKPEPKKKGIGYKVFVLKDGKLYPPMVANPDGAATPVGVWLDADAAPIAGESKTGRPQVKQGGKGTQGGSGKLAYRPGWHLGVVPYAIQFNRKDADGNKTLFPKNFVFAEVEYAADVDYQEEARQEGINPSGKYQHSLAGLKHLPTDGYYMYRTNPNPETDPWVITGAMKVNRILTRAEQAELVKNAGREPQQIQEGDIVTDDVVNSINQEIADAPKFSLKTYHGTGANFDRFDTSHSYEGAGSETFGHGIYVTKAAKIGASYALKAKVKKIKTPKAFKAIKNGDNWFGRFIDNVVRSSFDKAKKETFNRMDELIKEDENIVNDETKPEWKKNAAQKELVDFDKLKSLFEGLTEEDIPSLKRAKANRYEVEIPDDTGNNYLDWNKPMNKEQKKIVREGLEKLGVDVDRLVRNGYSLDKNFGDVYNGLLYYALNGTKFEERDSFVASSNFLSSLGFTGIKYYAGTIWGGAKKGDLNYVIFNEDDAKIVGNTKFSLKSKPVRFESGKKLSDEEKKEVLSTLKDAYKVNGVPYHIEETAGGKEKRVYEPTADSYVVSDITNRPLRFYITLPDGRVAHPTEVYPNISDNEVKSSATKQGLLDEEVDQIVSAAIGNMKDIADNAKAIEVLTELQNLPHETHDVGYGMNNAQSYNYKTGIFTSDAAQAIDYVVRRMRRKEDVPTEIPAALKKAVADSYGMVDNLIGGMSTTKFSLKKVNDDFNQRLEELVKNPNQKDKILRLGRSSSFLKVGGITDAEIELDFDKFIRKSGDKYKNNHPFAASDLINLPMALAEPIAVFNSTTANDHVVLTELQKDGKNFIVAVRAVEQHRKGGVVLEVNKITSLYPKEERGIVYWINNGRISNVDKEKALHFIEALQPHAGTTITDEELKSAANIINSFETTKGNGEKVDAEAPKTFDEFLNHPSLKFSIKNEQQRKAAEDAYEYAFKLRPNKSSQYALVDMSNPSSSPEYYEKKVLADRWRRFYNKAVHNELDDVYKDAWGNYKLFDLDRPFADQVNEVKGDVPNEFNAPDVVANKNADNESGAEYHEYKQDEPSSITYKDRYKAFKQREANREKTAGLRKERKETEDSYNSKSKERIEYNKQLMKEYMDKHALSSENDIPDDVWEDLRSKSFEKYQDELDSLFNKYKDLDKQIKAVAEPRFSLKEEKTLAGVHNITEEKLRKALKLGGFANPSLAVIDTNKSGHNNFGEISFIAPSALLDKRTGKTGGTWITDAYTQRYPSVERQMSEKGSQKFEDWVDSLEYPSAAKAEIKRQTKDVLEDNGVPAWELMYLKEKGIDIKAYDSNVDYRWKEIINDHPTAEDILSSMQNDSELNEKVTSLAKHAIIYPTWEKISLEVRRKMYEETGVKASPINPQVRKQTKEIFERDYAPTLLNKDGSPRKKDVKKVVEDIVKEHNDTKKYDFYLSKVKASNYVNKNGLYDDYIRWQENKLDEFGTKNRIFRGYTRDGSRKYVPETLENVSKAMREEADGQTNGSEYTSFGSFIAKLASRVDSTDEMRANKDKLSSNKDKEEFYEKWNEVYYELAKFLYNDVFYGEQRLHDIVLQADPKKYAKKEYGITLTPTFMKKLDALKNAVQTELKSAYFETKYNRPLRLNEFAAAVVPDNLGEDVRKGIENAGLPMYDYDPNKEGDRSRSFNEAINSSDNIRFSLKSMMEKPEGWKQANKKAIHIAEVIERDPKFSLKNLDGTLIKAGTYFSGGGLVEEGLKGIIDPVVAVEYDEKISGVYRNNFGKHIVTADVRDVDPRELVKQIDGEVEYFHASPVCKNYSQAKSNHAEVELDKETAASTAEFINAIKPKVVTIENVKGYKDSEAMKIITDALDANGYTWDADVYNAADYGGYTNRERLIVRAVREGKLPEKPKKMAHKSGWYEAVADIIPTLTEKKNGVAPWMDIRLKADGIDWRNIDKPLYVMGSAYADGKVPHAFADELLPTLRTKSGDVIVMPDGKVYRALGRVLARVSGVSDDYKMPFSENLSHTIIGNGIPTQLTEHVIAPLLTGSYTKFSLKKTNNVKYSRIIPTDVDKSVSSQIEKKYDSAIKEVMNKVAERDKRLVSNYIEQDLSDFSKMRREDINQELKRNENWRRKNLREENREGSTYGITDARHRITEATAERELEYRDVRAKYLSETYGLQGGRQTSLDMVDRAFEDTLGNETNRGELRELYGKARKILVHVGAEFGGVSNAKQEGDFGFAGTDRDISLFIDTMTRTSTPQSELAHTILHEMIHQATVGSINLVKKGMADGMLTPKQIEAVNTIINTYDAYKADRRLVWEEDNYRDYGGKDEYEFAAEMADAKQRRILSIPYGERILNAANELKRVGDISLWQAIKNALRRLFEVSDKSKMDKALTDIMDDFNKNIDDISMNNIEQTDFGLNGNTRFSLRGSTPYGKQMEEWMEKNHLEKGAVPMEKPIMKEGENIFDYANRMVEWTRNQNLWKTAPKQTGFQDALDKWKDDNGLSPDAYPPVRPHRENYSTEIGYAEDLEEYNKKKELWKSAPKPKDFDLSVDLEDMNKQLRNIRRAVLNQKNYDQRTVKAVSDLVRKMLNIGWGDGLSRGKVGNILSAAKNATGANDVKKYLDKAIGILAENYLNRLSTAYDNLVNTKGARADQSGVIKMGSLDAKGQAFMSEYKKAINMDDSSLNTYIANIEEDSAKNEDNVEMNDYRLAGIQAAIMYKQQIGGNDADIAELKRQIGELKNKKDATKEDKDLLKSLEKKLFENKFDRITMYENLLNNIQRMVNESKGRAKEFREEIAEHKNEILHRANLDLEGVDSTYYDTTTAKKKFVNNDFQRAVFSSTYTFEQFLKFFGKKSANGDGYLYNYFTKLNQDALDEEQLYNEMNRNALDEKTKELFGKEKFMKLVGIDGKGMKEMDVEVTDYSNKETGKRTIHLKQGQMLYIYLVNKETDGEMKLRAMGITEEDVAAIEENLDQRVKAMGEWLQDEYLPECQRRYQATHTKYFGAPMKEVENYFPLAINNRARNVKEDVNQDSDAMSQLAGTSTGAIVTRRVNVIPLDIENADAFEVAFNHLQEMEEWSAMLPFRQDINTLLSYTHFRNQVQNMSSVAYGSGKTLWDEFKQTAQIAAGTYKPKVNAGMMDSRIAAAMGGIAVAKISGRLWTAIKQSQSATVFLPECDFTRFVKNGVNPYGSWKWAMENIPDFRKRVEEMTYGDVKLRQYLDELEKLHDWTKTISKIGMAPNILVDGITCAVGARSVYETEVNRLTKLGYPKEKAEEKAYYKAVAAYNKTQQSSGGMYLSPMQVDRTYVSAALSLFKNANYAYGRMQIEACRGLARTYDLWGGKHKTTLIESMTRQIMKEDGLDENTARAIAKATYNRTFRQSIGRLINFATLVPVTWALYKVFPYLLTGDDDDKKKDMIDEAVLKGFATSLSDNYVIPFASNILNAGLKVEDGKPTFDPEVFRYQNLYINPATSDLANIYSMIGNQKWYSVANKLGMLGVQSLIGFNPETVGALYQALSEADYDNGNTAKEWQIGILKAISAPEESIRELYMDELGLKSGDIKKIPLEELEKRYAERQINRDNLLSQIVMDAETFNGYVDKYQKSFEKKIKDKMDKWDEYDKKKADEFFDTTSDPKLKDMIEKKRTKDANAAAEEQIANEGLNQEKKGKEPSEEAYDAVKMSIDVAEDNAISTYNKVLNKRYAALNDEYNNQTDAMKYIFMSKHPNFKSYKDLESEYTKYGKKMKELKEKLVSADGYDAKQTILKQIRAEREKFSELQSKVR